MCVCVCVCILTTLYKIQPPLQPGIMTETSRSLLVNTSCSVNNGTIAYEVDLSAARLYRGRDTC